MVFQGPIARACLIYITVIGPGCYSRIIMYKAKWFHVFHCLYKAPATRPALFRYLKYLSCVPVVDGKIHPEGEVQHGRWRGFYMMQGFLMLKRNSPPGTYFRGLPHIQHVQTKAVCTRYINCGFSFLKWSIIKYLHLYFRCFNILYRTNEVHSSMNTVSLITAQRYGKH